MPKDGNSIDKTAADAMAFARPSRLFANARSAFKALLAALQFRPGERILLPAYIGWSANEGSGVFDPVAELNLPCEFYRVDDRLLIDVDDLESRLRTGQVKALTLIHYFGYVDPRYAECVRLARRYGACVIEDEAHALFSDWIGGVCGRLGDACVYSLHKMLPCQGGMLSVSSRHAALLERIPDNTENVQSPWSYDLCEISRRRRENALFLASLLKPLAEELSLLREMPADGQVPQTLPVLVRRASRDELYFALNEAGFGAVSLYHTLIPQISGDAFSDSHRLSRTILNLPVHQDVEPRQLEALADTLQQLVRSHDNRRPRFLSTRSCSVSDNTRDARPVSR
ncbi:MAG: DegT/DnrJ/EryC1/StrS family aminotransferase [Thermoguttaceae bacterium]